MPRQVYDYIFICIHAWVCTEIKDVKGVQGGAKEKRICKRRGRC